MLKEKTSYKCNKFSGAGDPFAVCNPPIDDCWGIYQFKCEYDLPSSQTESQTQSQDTDI